MSIYQLARLTSLQTEGAMGYKIPYRCARATWRNCSSAWRHQCASSHWISCVGQHATHQKRCQHLLTLKKEHLRGNKSIARKKFWKPSLFGLRKFWWYQARFSKVACNYKKKKKHVFVPKSPEVTREMTLDLSWSGLKGMVHYITSILYYKCLRTLGFLHIRQSTWWEALRLELQPSIFLSITEMYQGHREH